MASARVIVVGVDGSPCSVEALRWAARQAELTGAELHALIAWSLPEIYGYTPRDFAGEARTKLTEAIDEALGAEPSVKVVADVVEGHAAEVLTEASRGAELLVVGSHGHGAFSGILLGAVSQRCVTHATCPVVVIRQQQS